MCDVTKYYSVMVMYLTSNMSCFYQSTTRVIEATNFKVIEGVYYFHDGTELVFTSPAQYTVIKKIEYK